MHLQYLHYQPQAEDLESNCDHTCIDFLQVVDNEPDLWNSMTQIIEVVTFQFYQHLNISWNCI